MCLWSSHFAVGLLLSWHVFDKTGHSAILSDLVFVDKALYDLNGVEDSVKTRSFTFDFEQLFNVLIYQNLLLYIFVGFQIVDQTPYSISFTTLRLLNKLQKLIENLLLGRDF